MALIYLRPTNPSARVVDPDTLQPLPAGGAYVAAKSFWYKRLARGEVEVSTPEGGSAPAPPAASPLLVGTGAPTDNFGQDGDFYLDADSNALYGPKAAGEWPAAEALGGDLSVDLVATAPAAVYAMAGFQSIDLTWEPPAFGAPTGYRIAWTGGTVDVSATTFSHTITGLTNGTAYAPTVRALNAAGAGPTTASNSVTPSASIPAGLRQPGLIGILDPDALTGANGSTVAGGTLMGGIGTAWTGINSPTLKTAGLNGRKAITCAQTKWVNTGLRFAAAIAGAPHLGSACTLFFVFVIPTLSASRGRAILSAKTEAASTEWSAATAWAETFSADSGRGRNRIAMSIELGAGGDADKILDYEGNNYSPATPEATLADGQGYILTVQRPGYWYLNGDRQAVRRNGVYPNALDDLMLGGMRTAGGMVGDIQFFAGYRGVLTQAQRWAVEAELAALFGLTVVQE